MTYTPVELRHVRMGRSLLGYNRAMVEQMIEEVAVSFEATWRERGELADRVEALDTQVAELRGREELLIHTLVAAEQAASDVREQARRAADTMLNEAQQEARAIVRGAQSQRDQLTLESRRIEAMLRAALLMVEQGAAATPTTAAAQPGRAPEAPVAAAPRLVEREPDAWPHEDTGSMAPVRLPPPAEALPPQEGVESGVVRRFASGSSRDFDWGD